MIKCVCDICGKDIKKIFHIDADLYNEGKTGTDHIKIEFDLCEYHYNMMSNTITNIDSGTAKKTVNPNG